MYFLWLNAKPWTGETLRHGNREMIIWVGNQGMAGITHHRQSTGIVHDHAPWAHFTCFCWRGSRRNNILGKKLISILPYLANADVLLALQGTKNPAVFLLVPLLLSAAVFVLYHVYWKSLRTEIPLDLVVRMFAGGFIPGGTYFPAVFKNPSLAGSPPKTLLLNCLPVFASQRFWPYLQKA